MEQVFQSLSTWLHSQLTIWVGIGLFGQSMFMMRFVFQWIHSERAKMSVVPEIFWYFSLIGGIIVLVYAIHKKDLVFIISQCLGILIYLRNISLIWANKKSARQAAMAAPAE